MAITEPYGNTATIGTTEYSLPNNGTTLTPIVVDGVYQVFIDFAAMTSGETYEVRLYEKILAAGAQRQLLIATLVGVQDGPFVLPSLILLHGWDVTVKKTVGTDRSISWSIRQVA